MGRILAQRQRVQAPTKGQQYRTSQRPWRRRNRLILIKMLILIVLYEKRRLQSLMQAMRGIGHGLAGRSGRNGEGRYTQVTADTP